jgi:uridine phosphorylase
VFDLAQGLEGLKRQWGVHAAGVIMSAEPLMDVIPIMKREEDGAIITQFDQPPCESLGLLKMDLLGLRNLTVIDDALFNINFETREIKPQLTSLQIIRFGTSGSLQAEIPVDSFVAGTHGIGLDNLMHFYRRAQNDEELQLHQAFVHHTQLAQGNITPYIHGASGSLLKHFTTGYHQGITVTCPGFFGPQGRVLRLGLANPSLIDQLTTFRLGNHRISNFEMETSAMYGMSRLLGHQCLSLNAIVANRIAKTFSANGALAVERLIEYSLERIVSSNL